MRSIIFIFVFACTFILNSCMPEPIEVVPENEFGALPEQVIYPFDNPSTPAKVALGRALFWDPILSGNKDVACVTCHHPDQGYAENLELSIGVGGKGLSARRTGGTLVKRNSMTVLNTAFNGIGIDGRYDPMDAAMFWDNRRNSLEKQSLDPIRSLEEMRGDVYSEETALDSVVARLEKISEYRQLFEEAFGSPGIDSLRLGWALATFERSLVANNSPFDQYARGQQEALSSLEFRGMLAFVEVGCNQCHSGPMFSDFQLHILGVPENPRLDDPDEGAGEHRFRTASLRNLTDTGPYMHNGVLETLEDVLEFYDEASNFDGEIDLAVDPGQLDPKLTALDLQDDQVAAIIAFLHALNDEDFDRQVPDRMPSGLPPGGSIRE